MAKAATHNQRQQFAPADRDPVGRPGLLPSTCADRLLTRHLARPR